MPVSIIHDGKIHSTKMEFNVAEHCNFSCDECSHFSPYLAVKFAAIDQFRKDLQALAEVYHVTRFRFVGGEPLLHKDILSFIQVVRDTGIADKIQICSNGALIHKVSDEVIQSIDSLSISWYPDSRCDQAKIDLAKAKCKAFDTHLKIDKIDQFRAMQMDTPITDKALVDKIYRTCLIAHSWGCQTIHEGRFYLCSRPLFTGAYLKKIGADTPDFQAMDGIDLHAPDLFKRITNYVQREQPLESCHYCLGTVGKYQPWRQLSVKERRTPTQLNRVAENMIDKPRATYLAAWDRFESALLRRVPSLKLSRVLNLVKNAPIRD